MSRQSSRLLSILLTRRSKFLLGVDEMLDYAKMHRVVPELEAQTKAGKINLTAIVNTHQYV